MTTRFATRFNLAKRFPNRNLMLGWLAMSLWLTACATPVTATPSSASSQRSTFTPLVVRTSPPLPSRTPPPVASTTAPTIGGRPATVAPAAPESSPRPLRLILVQHARCAWDQFWCDVEQGILDAAREMNVTVTILGPDALDLGRTAAMIDQHCIPVYPQWPGEDNPSRIGRRDRAMGGRGQVDPKMNLLIHLPSAIPIGSIFAE